MTSRLHLRLAIGVLALVAVALSTQVVPTVLAATFGPRYSLGSRVYGLDIAIDEGRQEVYTANFDGKSYSIIDVSSPNGSVQTFPLGGLGYGIGVNPVTRKIYISKEGNVIDVYNRDNPGQRIKSITDVGFPRRMSVNRRTNRIYVASHTGSSVAVIDGNTDTVIANVFLPNRFPVATAVDEDANRIYVTAWQNNNVAVIDGNNNSLMGNMNLQVPGLDSWAVAVNPINGDIYVTSNADRGYMTRFRRDGTKIKESSPSTRLTGVAVNTGSPQTHIIGLAQDDFDCRPCHGVIILNENLDQVSEIEPGFDVGEAAVADSARSRFFAPNWAPDSVVYTVQDDAPQPATSTPTNTALPTNTPTNTPTSTPTPTPSPTPSPTATATPATFPVSGSTGGTFLTADGASVEIPPGLFSGNVTIRYQPRASLGTAPLGVTASNRFFQLDTLNPLTGSPVPTPSAPYTITLSLTQDQLGTVISSTVRLYQFTDGVWQTGGISQTRANPLQATTNVFNLFGVFGNTNRVFLPTIVRQKVAW